MRNVLIILLIPFLLCSCATTKIDTPSINKEQSIRTTLDTWIDRCTYDDFISKFGEPYAKIMGIETFVIEWRETGNYIKQVGNLPWPHKKEWQLKVTFEKLTGIMTGYNLRFLEY